MTGTSTLRDHVRTAVRAEVVRQAWQLFATQGFEATTIDQIAEAAGMSRRTFFRYFTGKDELLLQRLVESGHVVADALRARPWDEPVWTALREAFSEMVEGQQRHAETSRPLQRMMRDEPQLRAGAEEKRRRWLDLLAPLVAERLAAVVALDEQALRLRSRAVAGAAMSCLEVAQLTWLDDESADLAVLLDDAMASVSGPPVTSSG